MTQDYFEWTDELFDIRKVFEKPEPLKGIRVLDLSQVLIGPETASLLADFGAEVIKIEPPGMGELLRSVDLWSRFWKNNSMGVMWVQRNKYFFGLNLKHPKGKAIFYELVRRSDIIIENYVPGVVDRIEVGYRHLKEINPRIIYVSISGFGQWGERWNWPSWDAAGQAASGASAVSGYDERVPLKLPYYPGDMLGAAAAFMATLAALYYREKTGEGQYIDITQAENLARHLSFIWTYVASKGEDWKRLGNRDASMIANAFKSKDGRLVTITALSDEHFKGLCEAMGKPELYEKYPTVVSRLKPDARDEIEKEITDWISNTESGEVIELSAKYGFSAGLARNSLEVYEDEHLRKRGSVWMYNDPLFGEMVHTGNPIKMSETPARIKWTVHPVGYHNRYILKNILSFTDEEIEELEKEKVIGYWVDFFGRTPPPEFDPEKDPLFRW
jgi:crotonobetainyl-CoA:carnitine CoA-transferase CaiB-like acyl-CoA transferase